MRRATLIGLLMSGVACARTAPSPEPTLPAGVAVATFDSVWRIVYHTHFDTTFNGTDWNAIGAELRPRAMGVQTNDDLRDVLREMVGRLKQSHFDIIPSEGVDAHGDSVITSIGQVGASLRLIDGQMVVERVEPGGGAANAGVHAGWIVQRIGELVIPDLIASFSGSPLSKLPGITPELVATARFYGEAGTAARAVFVDGSGARVTRDLMRAKQDGEPVKFGNLPVFVTHLESERLRAHDSTPAIGVIRFNF